MESSLGILQSCLAQATQDLSLPVSRRLGDGKGCGVGGGRMV